MKAPQKSSETIKSQTWKFNIYGTVLMNAEIIKASISYKFFKCVYNNRPHNRFIRFELILKVWPMPKTFVEKSQNGNQRKYHLKFK